MNREQSKALFERAMARIPGGVNSPVRAFRSVNDHPFFVARAKGPYLFDVDGNAYIDYVSSWGAIILGHAHEGLVEEIGRAIGDGTSYGACHPYEVDLAELIAGAFPSVDALRLTSSGTEATMSAIRLARGFTGKDGIIKFRGCYHGHADSLLVKAGSGLMTFGIPDSSGVPADVAKHTRVADFNDLRSVEAILDDRDSIGCIIVEPVMGNMGVILPEEGFLEGLRSLADRKGIVLIFDEVITGFRLTYGGAQHVYGVEPDMTCLGKIIGGGFPIGAFGGRREIMDHLAPLGGVYQAGTLSGNPVAVRAGMYVLRYLRDHRECYDALAQSADRLTEGLQAAANRHGLPYRVNRVGSMFTGFFTDRPVDGYEGAVASDRSLYERFFKGMLEEGVFFAPSPFEAAFLNIAHGAGEVALTIDAADRVCGRLQG
jgi:glutamate-1-semialdehyde 2,1-aminomutase